MRFDRCADSHHPPLVVHIVHRLAVGGLENGLVNLINHMPAERYRHAIVCLTDYTDFAQRIRRPDVPIIALHKRAGKDLGAYARMWQVLRRMRPDIVHTRSLPALEYIAFAALAGVPGRIHGEHGRDIYDLDGSRYKYHLLRKAIKPLTHCYTAVSADLAHWLIHKVGVQPEFVRHIYNGVDTQRFSPRAGARPAVGPAGFAAKNTVLIGTVGRMQTVKDQLTLVRAFLHILHTDPGRRESLRLAIIGDGPLQEAAQQLLHAAGAASLAWLPGERADIPEIMQALDVFVLPSLAEGISNTILEAMASGLPVVATRVGGNPELVEEGRTGLLVPPSDPLAMAIAIHRYLAEPDTRIRHGQAGWYRVESSFSIATMVHGYLSVYDTVLHGKRRRAIASAQRTAGREEAGLLPQPVTPKPLSHG